MVSRIALVSIVLFAVVAGRAPAEDGLKSTRFLKRCATYLDSNGRIQDIWLTGPRKFVEGALRELVTTEVGRHVSSVTPSERIAQFTQQWDNSAWGNRSRKEGGGYMLPADSNLWKLRMETMRALVASGPDAVKPLLEALRSQDVATRILAAQTLGFLGKHVPSKPLVKALRDDPEASVRLYAADALGMIGGADVRESLESLKETEKNKDVRKHIMYALGRKNRDGAAAAERLVAWNASNMDTAHVGRVAPDFELVSVNGKRYRLSSFRGKKAVVLVFIYGDT